MNSFKLSIALLVLLAAISIGPAASAQPPQPPPTSAANSPTSATPASKPGTRTLLSASSDPQSVAACNAAADELLATRELVTALERENTILKSRLETEKQTTALLRELNETRRSETEALRATVAAKNETIAAKDSVIASQERLVTELKGKKVSPWKRVLDVLVGVGVGVVLK